MEKSKQRVRELILYEYRLGHTDHEAHVNICRAEGPNAGFEMLPEIWQKIIENNGNYVVE